MNKSLRQYRHALAWVAVIIAVTVVAACASIERPEGGPRDLEPPSFVGSRPEPRAINVDRGKFQLYFNENISIDDVSNKVVVSPAQKSMPSIFANGHKITVELRDTLIPNTTYTIDFGDAIKDLNEGNIIDGFSYDFSTGDAIDSLEISGMLFEARNLEPAQGMLVGVYSNLADSAITTLPMQRIARTNQYGQFTIRNLAPGRYRLFALNDMDRNYFWNRSEDVAFCDSILVPSVKATMRTDSLRTDSGLDSVVTHEAAAYYPNDILLTWFNENFKAQYLKDKNRTDSIHITFVFGAPADSLPDIHILNGPLAGSHIDKFARLTATEHLDTLQYWITDNKIVQQDTLQLAMRYLRTDSTQNLSATNDTIRLTFKRPKPKKEDKKKEKSDSVKVPDPLVTFRSLTGATQEPYLPHLLAVDEPLDSLNNSLVLLEQTADSVWTIVEGAKIEQVRKFDLMNYKVVHRWQTGMKYRLTVDSLAARSIYGKTNKATLLSFQTRPLEEYASLTFTIDGLGSEQAVVELLDASDKVLRTATTENGSAHFNFVLAGAYYARLFIDRNRNGIYDTGDLLRHIQPEEVFYFNKKINVKRNWDISQTWDLYAVPVDMQKPDAIKKNKPKKKVGDKDKPTDEEEDDEFSTGFGSGNRSSGSRSLRSGLSIGGNNSSSRTKR